MKFAKMAIGSCTLVLFALVVLPKILTAAEFKHRIDADLYFGYDDNPFKLSDSLNAQDGNYYDLKLQLTNRRPETGFYYRLKGNFLDYLDGETDDADVSKYYAELGYRWRLEVNQSRADNNFSLDYNTNDSTYFSRRTGTIATFRGNLIGDRYDSNWLDLRGRGKYPFSKKIALTYDVRFRDKQYEDYTSIGLSDLDYSELKIQSGMDIKFTNHWRWKPAIEWRGRYYGDKRSTDVTGNPMPDTDLEFNYIRVLNDLIVDISETVDLKVGYDYNRRTDNGSGYYDNTLHDFNIRIRYRENLHELAFYINYADKKFNNQTTNVTTELEEENKTNDGVSVRLKYEYDLSSIVPLDISILCEIDHGEYDNSDPVYAYDRTQFYTGIESRF